MVKKKSEIPFFFSPVQAGFPSPADDFIQNKLDLNELIIKHPAATFFVRAYGESMKEAFLTTGDILVVDRALTPADGKIIVALLNGEFTVKRLRIKKNTATLMPENPDYAPISITPEMDFEVWGVVTYIIHACTH